MAKDTEKLIRQLSLISFLMANRRPVSALEIKREVEGYSSMNDDAFARRFYADRAELESLGVSLQVDKPQEGFFEAELYALPPENYYLPPIEFTDAELAALNTALGLLEHEFAYAEPLRLALQQVSWGRPNPLDGPEDEQSSSVGIVLGEASGGRELSQRLAKIETAISRRKRIEFSYYSLERDEVSDRKVDPYHLVFRGGQFYLIGHSHERGAVRVFRLSRIRGKVSYATKAEHDFSPPEDFDRRDYAQRAGWQMGGREGRATIFLRERIAWLVERDHAAHGELRRPRADEEVPGRGRVFETDYSSQRQIVSWVLGWRGNALVLDPPELAEEHSERLSLLGERHEGEFEPAEVVDRPEPRVEVAERPGSRSEHTIRPERFARLVTLAGMLIAAGREGGSIPVESVLEGLNIDESELREDLDVLNVVNFGGGTYVLYAEVQGDRIEVDADTYGENFARPARLLPLEAKALVAAIDLFGDHLPEASLTSARSKIVEALGHDPSEEGLEIAPGRDDSTVVSTVHRAIAERRVLEIHYYKENEDEFSKREVEPYKLVNGPEGWYAKCYDLRRGAKRHFRLDRMRSAETTERRFEPREELVADSDDEEWLKRGEVGTAGVARVWVSPERARWMREERTVVEELADGAVVVELPFGSREWLVREILKGAGDLVVLGPPDARRAVLGSVAGERAPAATH